MRYTNDPISDFDAYDREQARKLARLPVCADCGEPIQQDFAFCDCCGEWLCNDCLSTYIRPVEVE